MKFNFEFNFNYADMLKRFHFILREATKIRKSEIRYKQDER